MNVVNKTMEVLNSMSMVDNAQPPNFSRSKSHPQYVFVQRDYIKEYDGCNKCAFNSDEAGPPGACTNHNCYHGIWLHEIAAIAVRLETA